MAIKLQNMSAETVKSKSGEKAEAKVQAREKKARKEPKFYPSHHRGHGKLSPTVCVKTLTGEVKRLSRSEADVGVCSGSYTYAKKSEWRDYCAKNGVVRTNPVSNKKGKK